jgi:Domain of unknown function (DUF4258)
VSRYQLIFRIHALKRMRQRHIDEEDIHLVLANGEIIENYPNTAPFPSRLVMGWCRSRCLHIVVADNMLAQEIIVITAYEPDPLEWEQDLKRRKR